MDTLLLSRTLQELIIDHDRIPLPGIGYLLTRTAPAAFSEDGKTIYPPCSTLLFEEDRSAESGEMSSYYSRTGISPLLEQLKNSLEDGQETVLDGLGKFQCTENGRITFIYDSQNGVLSRAFGFGPIPLKPLAVKSQTEEHDNTPALQAPVMESVSPISEDTAEMKTVADTTETSGRHKSGRTWIIILSVLAFLTIAAVVLVELGRNGYLDSLIYTEEELELIRQQGD